ncbi:MAG TPA: CAP domain-containing protein [Pyrinomonadaceae bacterium]|nr:CAP domain-containing protein [Pyrinomonadaceae bacterium]
MNLKTFLLKSAVVSALLFGAFSADFSAQTIKAEKTGSVASYIRDKEEEDAGNVRKRIAQPENVKIVSSVKPSELQILDFEKLAFGLINQKRAENGLEPLVWSDDVAKIARLHSENMVRFNFFSHKGIDGKMVDDRADSVGLTKWTAMGENIAYNRGYKNPIETAVEKWMLSESHRENLLNDRWKESAIGIAVTDDGTFYFTQVFLKRK